MAKDWLQGRKKLDRSRAKTALHLGPKVQLRSWAPLSARTSSKSRMFCIISIHNSHLFSSLLPPIDRTLEVSTVDKVTAQRQGRERVAYEYQRLECSIGTSRSVACSPSHPDISTLCVSAGDLQPPYSSPRSSHYSDLAF